MLEKLTIQDMRKIAKNRGGKCISKRYKNNQTKLKWQCKEEHVWEAIPANVKRGSWCPCCAGNIKLTIKDMQKIARRKGGRCLSARYKNSFTKLKWQCAEGHVWRAKPDNVKQGTWCPYCAGNIKSTIEEMQKIARKKKGKCLSSTYFNSETKLKWQCAEGHTWEAIPRSIKRGHWCPICKRKVISEKIRKYSVPDMQELAREKGGKCLSVQHISVHEKLKWQCAEGHVWEATPDNVKRGTWCPYCTENIGEKICREYFERIFSKKFPPKWPKWLVTPQDKRLELDGYCEDLNVAFEYHGKQHYDKGSWLLRKPADYKARIEYDELKRSLCKLNKVALIEIPYYVPYEKLGDYIINKCKKKGIPTPKRIPSMDYKSFNIYAATKIESMQTLAEERGGRCLSKKYINSQTKIRWQCAEGHIWEAIPSNIKRGRWCPVCGRKAAANKRRGSLSDMYKIAKQKRGKCLSTKYVNSQTKLKWQCAEGHIWTANPNSIKSGHWCPRCVGRDATIKDMRKIAWEKGGKCLSKAYIDAHTKLKWQCAEGHTWEATPASVKYRTWCPVCARLKAKITM